MHISLIDLLIVLIPQVHRNDFNMIIEEEGNLITVVECMVVDVELKIRIILEVVAMVTEEGTAVGFKDCMEEVDIPKHLVKLLNHLHGIIQSKRLTCLFSIIWMMCHLFPIANMAGILEVKGGIEVVVRIVIFPVVDTSNTRKI